MEVLDAHVTLRRDMNLFYKNIFEKSEGIMVFTEPSEDIFSNHWLTCITVDSDKYGFTSDKIRLALDADNIESRPLWKPMHLQPIFKDAPFYGEGVAQSLFENGICLPSGSNLTEDDKQRILRVLEEIR